LVGAGTLYRVDTARRCLDAGAVFLTTPGLDLEIVNFALGATCGFSWRIDAHRGLGRVEDRRRFRQGLSVLCQRRPRLHSGLKGPFSEVPLIATAA